MDSRAVLTRLLAAGDRISRSWNVEEGLSALVHGMFGLLKPQSVAIALADERSGEYRIVAWRGLSAGFVNHHRISHDAPIVRRIIVGGESVLLDEFGPAEDDAADGLRLETEAGSLMAVPVSAMNRPLGMIIATSDQANFFTDEHLLLARVAARMAGACHDRCSLYGERQHLSCVDRQSGLWSFEFFCRRMNEEIQRSRRGRKPASLLLIDIDDFTRFHQTHGEEAADELVRNLVDRIRSTMRGIDFAGHFGPSSILVALPETDLRGGRRAAERVLAALHERPVTGADEHRVTASIGVSEFVAGDEDGAGEMLDRAQKALYLAQFHGGNRVETTEG